MDNFLIGKEAQDKVVAGVNKMADAVKLTLGAQGKLALIKTYSKYPELTKDGVDILKKIQLDCVFESLGASAVLEASEMMLEKVGDNTTSSIVLAQALIKSGLEQNKPYTEVIRDINSELEVLKINLKKSSKKATKKDIQNVATIAANGDLSMGRLVAQAFSKVGKNGKISVEEGEVTKLVFQEGLKVNKGWLLPHFITNTVNKTVELKAVNILVVEGAITTPQQISNVIMQTREQGRNLLLFCEDVDDEVMRLLIATHLNPEEPLKICVCHNPSFGENKKNIMVDISTYTDGVVWQKAYDDNYKMGFATKVVVTEDNCFINVENIPEQIKARAEEIQEQIKIKKSENLVSRLASINNNVAIIKISSNSVGDLSEKMARLDDSIRAVQTVGKFGVLAGGGLSLYNESLKGNYSVWKDVLKSPIKQILDNGGVKLSDVKCIGGNMGYNIRTNMCEDFFESGILDSTYVVLTSLETAANLACNVLSINILIV